MRLLIDTHVLVWVPTGDPRMSRPARAAMQEPDAELFVSAVTAFELTELQRRGRVALTESIDEVLAALGASLLDFPADAWAVSTTMPDIHRDPVDRMMIAHAAHAGLTLVTADKNVRRYPVKSIW